MIIYCLLEFRHEYCIIGMWWKDGNVGTDGSVGSGGTEARLWWSLTTDGGIVDLEWHTNQSLSFWISGADDGGSEFTKGIFAMSGFFSTGLSQGGDTGVQLCLLSDLVGEVIWESLAPHAAISSASFSIDGVMSPWTFKCFLRELGWV